MAETGGPDLHQRYFEFLLDRVRSDQYPSTAVLDTLERSIGSEEERTELVDVLLEKVEADRYPSVPMIERIARISG